MKIFSVHHKAVEPAIILSEGLETRFVKEGIAWGALIAPPWWAIFHRLWLVLVGIVVFYALAGVISNLVGLNPNTSALLFIALHVILALEGNNLYRWTLTRRGYKEIGTVTGASLEKCERRFFESLIEPDNRRMQRHNPPPPANKPLATLRPVKPDGEGVIGLFPEPDPKP